MSKRIVKIIVLLFWLELGLALILAPWSNAWDANFFLYQYPFLGFFVKNPFLRGAVSGLGFVDVMLALEAFRRETSAIVDRTS